MRIEGGKNGFQPENLSEALPNGQKPQVSAVGKGSATDAAQSADATAQAPYLAAALAAPSVNLEAIAEAKALLSSGQLDTPRAARQAAQAIVDIGL